MANHPRRSSRLLLWLGLLIAATLFIPGTSKARLRFRDPGQAKQTRVFKTLGTQMQRTRAGLARLWRRCRRVQAKDPIATLTLVRHGQSQWNLENRFTGWVDVPLTEKGRCEARRAGELVKSIKFDRAYTSGLQRAQESLKLMMKGSGEQLPVRCSTRLNERHYGKLQGLNKAKTAERLGQERVHRWRRSWDGVPPGGESLKMTADRTLPYFNRTIMRDLKQGKNVLVVAHGNSLRAIVMALDGLSPSEVPKLQLATGVPLVYQIDRAGKVVSKRVLASPR